jgi:protein-S-isoprenylcysteine O-methyltransferase Ste14
VIGKHILLTIVVAAAASYEGWQLAPTDWSATRIAGLCLAVLGFTFWTIARFQLGISFAVTARAKQLVTRGIYSKIRNPIYLFGSIFIIGFALYAGRPLWLLIFIAIIPLQVWRMGKEARVLEEKFGNEYRAYRARTWF